MDGRVGRAVEVAQVARVEPVLEEVQERQVDAVQRGVAAELRDPPVQGPVQGEVRRGRRRPGAPSPRRSGAARRGRRRRGARPRRGRPSARSRCARRGSRRSAPRPRIAPRPLREMRHPDGRVGDEHAAAGAGARLDQAAHLEQAHGLVDRRDRDAEALAQVVLGADPLAGRQAVAEDLDLEVACDRLRARHARRRGALGLRGERHDDRSYGRGDPWHGARVAKYRVYDCLVLTSESEIRDGRLRAAGARVARTRVQQRARRDRRARGRHRRPASRVLRVGPDQGRPGAVGLRRHPRRGHGVPAVDARARPVGRLGVRAHAHRLRAADARRHGALARRGARDPARRRRGPRQRAARPGHRDPDDRGDARDAVDVPRARARAERRPPGDGAADATTPSSRSSAATRSGCR